MGVVKILKLIRRHCIFVLVNSKNTFIVSLIYSMYVYYIQIYYIFFLLSALFTTITQLCTLYMLALWQFQCPRQHFLQLHLINYLHSFEVSANVVHNGIHFPSLSPIRRTWKSWLCYQHLSPNMACLK